ncbi:MAG TPA: DNA polymerase I, partial [Fibrobacteraceae bacterium]|nr:DNA polymerase I [Fibrobacteraceae bacterium]
MPEKRLFLLDSYALAFRMFYAYYKSPLINSAGLNVSMVHGYWGAVLRILDTHKPTHFAIVRDVSAPTFRHELFPEYKANRGPMPEEMVAQMPLLGETLAASGITLLSEPGFEADDVMASVAVAAEKAGFDQIFIVTKDKDMAQMVNDKIHLFHLEKGAEGIDFGPEQVLEKYGVPPSKIRDYLALMGDSSDNIPGVPKIGPKTAAQLLSEFDNIDNLYLNLDKITKKGLHENLRENKEKAFLSRELVTLQSTRGFSGTLEQLEYTGVNVNALTEIFQKNEINSLLRLLKPISDRSSQKASSHQESLIEEKEPDYVLVDSIEKWESMKLEFESKKIIAVDTETDSLSPITTNLVGLCLSCDEAKGYYIPLAHTDELGLELNNFDKKLVSDWFLSLWNNPQIQWVFHNAKFDLHVLKRSFGIHLNVKILDSLIAAWMLSPGDMGLGLDEQVRRHLHHEMIPIENLIGRGKNQITFNRVPVNQAYTYGAEDAVYTLRLWNKLLPLIQERDYEKFFLELEMPCLKVLFEMEEKGVSVDSEELKRQSAEMELRILDLEKEIYALAEGVEFNIASPKQLSEILFDHLGLPVIKKTQTGRSTDSVVLEELSVVAPHPIVFAIMEYREIKKLQSTYLSVLPELVNPETKRIHTSFIQWGTATGRLSSREPNLQNIPIRTEAGKKIRAAFVPQKKDDLILSVDYSQIELP